MSDINDTHDCMLVQYMHSSSQLGGEIFTFPDTPTTQGLSLWCFNTVGGEIFTFPDTPTTQGLSLWCFNTVPTYTSRPFCNPRATLL